MRCRRFCVLQIIFDLLQPFRMFGCVSHQLLGAALSLRSSAGLGDAPGDVLDESGGGDVEDELAPELDDNRGTTRSTNCPFCN